MKAGEIPKTVQKAIMHFEKKEKQYLNDLVMDTQHQST